MLTKSMRLLSGVIAGVIFIGLGTSNVFSKESLERKISSGRMLYGNYCASCHQMDGAGIGSYYPPLAKSDFIKGNKERAIEVVGYGLSEPITVNGHHYNGFMPSMYLTNEQIAEVLTFIYNSWGNEGGEVTEELVDQVLGK